MFSRKIIAALFLCILPTANATMHVVYYDGKVVHIFSDTLVSYSRSDGDGKLNLDRHVCKVAGGKHIVFLPVGHMSSVTVVDGRVEVDGQSDFSSSSQRIVESRDWRTAQDVSELYELLVSDAEQKLKRQISLGNRFSALARMSAEDKEKYTNTFMIQGMLIWFDHDSLESQQFFVRALDFSKVSVNTWKQSAKSVPRPALFSVPYPDDIEAFSELKNRPKSKDAPAIAHQFVGGVTVAVRGHPDSSILEFMTRYANRHPQAGIGAPFTIAYLTPSGLTWTDLSNMCPLKK